MASSSSSRLLFSLFLTAILVTCILSKSSTSCPQDRIGERCEHKNPCTPNPCQNGGKCDAEIVEATGSVQIRCDCPPGYTASLCEIALTNACTEQPCHNDGHCILTPFGVDEFKCQCAVGYQGDYCEIDVDECAHGHICENGGTCENHDGGYHCLCAGGWEGEHCEINQDDCVGYRCHHGGTCVDLVGSFKCECAKGYTGLVCHLKDGCSPNPCRNGSRCWTNPTDGSATCGCERGFTGARCDIDINECETDPCERGGICVNTPGSFVCHCPKGITGDLCTININECESNPCRNAGTCADFIGYFVCGCLEGYTGKYCETKIGGNPKSLSCPLNACQHGGVCKPTTGAIGYECLCRNGYSGNRCQTRVSSTTCTNDRCENGGMCSSNRTTGISNCLCPSAYGGDRCEIKLLAPLLPQPVVHPPSIVLTTYDAADEYELELCRRNDCKRRANNGICDAPCNYYACDYDGGDCSAGVRPFENCTHSSYCAHAFHDGKCDTNCNNEACLFDGFDCQPSMDGCNSIYRGYCLAHFGNGLCDSGCNTASCGWDGGDCDAPDITKQQLLTGEIIVVLLVEPRDFAEREKQFLMSISKAVRAVVRIQLADDGSKMVYAWSNASAQLTGVNVVLNVDVSMCGENCFSDVKSVAGYLGASNAKQDLLELGVPMYRASAQEPQQAGPQYMIVIVTLLILLAIVLVSLLVLARKRKINAPVWFPPPPVGAESTKGSSIGTGLNTISTYDHYQMSMKCDHDFRNNNKRTRRIGPEGQEIMVADGLNHYLANGCYPQSSIFNGCSTNEQPSIISDAPIDDGNTPLILSIRYSREDEVQAQLDAGADPNECDERGNTPLHHAVLVNNVNIIRRLLAIKNCEVDPANIDGQTPLILAAKVSMASIECAQELLRHKADCCGSGGRSAVDNDGKTALHWAALNNNVRLIDELIAHGANKDAQDNKDETPLFFAAREGHMEAVELLVAKYGASKEITDQMDRWPRDIAAENGHHACANYLDKVQSPRALPFTHLTVTGTLQSHRNGNGSVTSKPKSTTARRSRSVRETKKEKTTAPVVKSPLTNDDVSPYAATTATAAVPHVMLQQQQLIHHHSPSLQSSDSPAYSTTPSPPNTTAAIAMMMRGNAAAASSSCMLSPYSEPHSGGSTSGLSPPQMTTMTTCGNGIKGYRSPPPYASGYPDKLSTAYYHHSPPDHTMTAAYYQSVVDGGGGYIYATPDNNYCQSQQQQHHLSYFPQQQSNYCHQQQQHPHITTLSHQQQPTSFDYYHHSSNYANGGQMPPTNGY